MKRAGRNPPAISCVFALVYDIGAEAAEALRALADDCTASEAEAAMLGEALAAELTA